MNINHLEFIKWQEQQQQLGYKKVYGEKGTKKPDDPQKEKKYERELKRKRYIHWYKHENACSKKVVKKRFRQKWKREREQGEWHTPVNREYRTYGYETW
ncbi:hypothetical protein [Bacillus cereus]|uniref:hypothetical protein n=1 Tax=Bacillus cereus TaxID=1396 RepID=UPI000B4A5BEB|nr:hypothetical protein [Bacillus cereus]